VTETIERLAKPANIRIGKKLKERRKTLELTQAQLSYASGVSQATISAVEHGGQSPSLVTFVAICGALGMSPEERNDLLEQVQR